MRRRLMSLVCLVSLLSFLVPIRHISADTPVNLLTDGGFESATYENQQLSETYAENQWVLYTAGNPTQHHAYYTADAAYSGDYGMKLVDEGSTDNAIQLFYNYRDFDVDKIYRVTFFAKKVQTLGSEYRFALVNLDIWQTAISIPITRTDWKEYSFTMGPAGSGADYEYNAVFGTSMQLRFDLNPKESTGTLYVDDVSMVELSPEDLEPEPIELPELTAPVTIPNEPSAGNLLFDATYETDLNTVQAQGGTAYSTWGSPAVMEDAGRKGVKIGEGQGIVYTREDGMIDKDKGTLSMWVNLQKPISERTVWSRLADIGGDFAGNSSVMRLLFSPGHENVFTEQFVEDGFGAYVNYSIPLAWNTNEWHHVSYTWNAAKGTSTLYVDGDPESQHLYSAPALDMNSLYIGNDYMGRNAADAILDDIRIYNVDLDDDEMRTLAGKTPLTGLEKLAPFMDNSWKLNKQVSDEFNKRRINTNKWHFYQEEDSWGSWSWNEDNAFTQDGKLHIRMEYEPPQQEERQRYFKSAMIRTDEPVLYGYFEARIKAQSRFPGTSGAFWMNRELKDDNGNMVAWTEIDITELGQYWQDPRIQSWNTHVFKLPGAEFAWKTATGLSRFTDARLSVLDADPRDDFHVYGLLWTKDELKYYYDGKLVFTRKNDYWHQPLNVIFNIENREPLGGPGDNSEDYRADPGGFPTDMEVDYVRVWQQLPDQDDDVQLIYNNKYIAFYEAPIGQSDNTLIQASALLEAMGASVSWNGKTSTLTAARGGKTVELTVGQKMAKVNGVPVELNRKVKRVNGEVMAPIGFVKEAFGVYVEWNKKQRTLILYDTAVTESVRHYSDY